MNGSVPALVRFGVVTETSTLVGFRVVSVSGVGRLAGRLTVCVGRIAPAPRTADFEPGRFTCLPASAELKHAFEFIAALVHKPDGLVDEHCPGGMLPLAQLGGGVLGEQFADEPLPLAHEGGGLFVHDDDDAELPVHGAGLVLVLVVVVVQPVWAGLVRPMPWLPSHS